MWQQNSVWSHCQSNPKSGHPLGATLLPFMNIRSLVPNPKLTKTTFLDVPAEAQSYSTNRQRGRGIMVHDSTAVYPRRLGRTVVAVVGLRELRLDNPRDVREYQPTCGMQDLSAQRAYIHFIHRLQVTFVAPQMPREAILTSMQDPHQIKCEVHTILIQCRPRIIGRISPAVHPREGG